MTTTIIKYEIGSWGKQIKSISDRRNSMHFITLRSAIYLKYRIYIKGNSRKKRIKVKTLIRLLKTYFPYSRDWTLSYEC